MTKAAVTTAPHMLCAYCSQAQGFIRRPQKLVSSKVPLGSEAVGDGMLHPGVGDDDEEAGDPGAEEDHEGGAPVRPAREAFLAEEEEAEEGGFEEEGEDAFHGEGLADDSAGAAGELGPVGAELKLHGDAGDDAEDEVDGEDAGPEARGLVVAGVVAGEGDGLEDDDEQRQPHGELGEEIVIGDGERKMDAVEEENVHLGPHYIPLRVSAV